MKKDILDLLFAKDGSMPDYKTAEGRLYFHGGILLKRLMKDLEEDFTEDQTASILAAISTVLLNDDAIKTFLIKSREISDELSDNAEKGG